MSPMQALRAPERLGITGTFDLVSITPPYEEVVYADLINDVMNSPVSSIDRCIDTQTYIQSRYHPYLPLANASIQLSALFHRP